MTSKSEDHPGDNLRLGAFRLLEPLSLSFFGERWVARHGDGDDDGALVCLRRVPVAHEPGASLKDELCTAAWFAMDIESSHTAKVLDVVAEGDELAIVTEYCEGETMRTLLRVATEEHVWIPPDVLIRIALDILEGLSAIERAAIDDEDGRAYRHGCLSPDSVLVGVDGTTMLLDPATGSVAARSAGWPRISLALAYQAPEQLDAGSKVDAGSDLFALGVMLWECFMGDRLFDAPSLDAQRAQLKSRAIERIDGAHALRPHDIPATLADVVEQLLQRDPTARFDSADAATEAFEGLRLSAAARVRTSEEIKRLAGPEARAKRHRLGTTMSPPAPPTDEIPVVQIPRDDTPLPAALQAMDEEQPPPTEQHAAPVAEVPPPPVPPPTPPQPKPLVPPPAASIARAPARVSVAHLRAHAPAPAVEVDVPPPLAFASTPDLFGDGQAKDAHDVQDDSQGAAIGIDDIAFDENDSGANRSHDRVDMLPGPTRRRAGRSRGAKLGAAAIALLLTATGLIVASRGNDPAKDAAAVPAPPTGPEATELPQPPTAAPTADAPGTEAQGQAEAESENEAQGEAEAGEQLEAEVEPELEAQTAPEADTAADEPAREPAAAQATPTRSPPRDATPRRRRAPKPKVFVPDDI